MTIRPATPSAHKPQLLIRNLLHTALVTAPHQTIHYQDRLSLTYTELGQRINRLASGLKNLGVTPGDTVAVMDWDSHRYLECYFAIPMMGAILHTVNVRLSPEQLVYTINHAEDDVLLVHSDFLPVLAPLLPQLVSVKKFILLQDGPTDSSAYDFLDLEYEAMLSASSPEFEFPDFDEESVATTFYTTGTTGLPKGVYFSHRQLVLHTYGSLATLCGQDHGARIDASDVYMPITPMFHVHAWGLPYLMTHLGARQIYPGRYEPETLVNLVARYGVSFSHCVPTILHMLLESDAAKTCDFRGWKVIIGGSALSRGLCRRAMELGINIYTGYGMSETCPILTLALAPESEDLDLEHQLDIRCKTGLPISGVELRVVDGGGNPLPHDGKSTGEVVVRAPWLTMGYLKEPEKSEELWEGGWLHTGDIGHIDPNGYLQITDRLKDVIKTGGEWISSLELEDIVSQLPEISEVAVIGVPHEKWGERPMVLAVPRDQIDSEQLVAAVKSAIAQKIEDGVLPRFGMPEEILIVDSIPKTSVGKLNKRQLRKDFAHSTQS